MTAEIICLADYRTLRTPAYAPPAIPLRPIDPTAFATPLIAGLAWWAAVLIFLTQRSELGR